MISKNIFIEQFWPSPIINPLFVFSDHLLKELQAEFDCNKPQQKSRIIICKVWLTWTYKTKTTWFFLFVVQFLTQKKKSSTLLICNTIIECEAIVNPTCYAFLDPGEMIIVVIFVVKVWIILVPCWYFGIHCRASLNFWV
jgi:hypothetical protein